MWDLYEKFLERNISSLEMHHLPDIESVNDPLRLDLCHSWDSYSLEAKYGPGSLMPG